jgi:hypothetical protein
VNVFQRPARLPHVLVGVVGDAGISSRLAGGNSVDPGSMAGCTEKNIERNLLQRRPNERKSIIRVLHPDFLIGVATLRLADFAGNSKSTTGAWPTGTA